MHMYYMFVYAYCMYVPRVYICVNIYMCVYVCICVLQVYIFTCVPLDMETRHLHQKSYQMSSLIILHIFFNELRAHQLTRLAGR